MYNLQKITKIKTIFLPWIKNEWGFEKSLWTNLEVKGIDWGIEIISIPVK